MACFDAIADLPLEIEACEFEGLEFVLGEFERLTTVIKLRGGGHEGIGEDVTYDAVDHVAQQSRRRRPRGSPARYTFDELLRAARRDRPLPGRSARARGLPRLPALGLRVGGARPGAAPGGHEPGRGARPRAAAAQLRQLDAAGRLRRRRALLDRAGARATGRLPDAALQARPDQRLGRRADRRPGRDRRGRLARPQGLLQRHPGRRRNRPRALREADRRHSPRPGSRIPT